MARGQAKLAIGEGLSVWVLEAADGFGDAGFHAHHAIQITVCLEGELTLSTAAQCMTGSALAVKADSRHRFEARGLLAFLFVEPESPIGRALTARLFAGGDLAAVDSAPLIAECGALRGIFDRPDAQAEMLDVARRALDRLAPITCLRRPDERIQRIIDFAASNLDRPLTLETAAPDVFLSPSRLRHLFVEQTGLAFRTYLLWLRLVRAVQHYSEGKSLTEAAHDAGFADSAHFSRVFKRTFGLPATTLTRV